MTAAIHFHPEAYTIDGPKLMGRNAAGESFLRGFIKYGQADAFWLQVSHPNHAQVFANTAAALGVSKPVKAFERQSLPALVEPGCLYLPGPGLGEHAWQRAAALSTSIPGQSKGWSLCGITHTTASARAMDSITELLTAPVQPWDALICTSSAVRDNVDRLLGTQAEYLRRRLGATRIVLPQLPVIPLGIHTADFQFTETERANARNALGADANTLIVLYTGRLSFHAKAHPLAMYQALEQAAQRLPAGKRILLVECGWHANDYIRAAFDEAAKAACPSITAVTLDGRDAANRQTAWASADVFCSLSDNIQETFGIVPIEAMAAGLPVVVSDWDGYKDTVRHGVDGFRIPTLMPGPGLGTDMAYRHALEIDNYDVYCGNTCSVVAVDVAETANSFTRLFESETLCKTMGEAGRQRAREIYDWARIIPRYEALWAELAEIRARQGVTEKPPALAWPARMDPFAAFAAYPTQLLTPETRFKQIIEATDIVLANVNRLRALGMVKYATLTALTEGEIATIIEAARQGPQAASQLVAGIEPQRRAHALRGLAGLVKLGVLSPEYS